MGEFRPARAVHRPVVRVVRPVPFVGGLNVGIILDLSQWNTVADWNAVRSNAEAVILRCGYTLSAPEDLNVCVDHKYHEYRRVCEALGIPFSLYYVTSATTAAEAETEAAYVIGECRDMKSYVLPVFVDSEKITGKGRADNLTKAARTKAVRAFCAALQRKGIPAGVYASASWWRDNLDADLLPFSRWVAEWGTPAVSMDCLLWQYTNNATVPGITGRVDASSRMDVFVSPAAQVTEIALDEVGYLEKASASDLDSKKGNPGRANYTKYGRDMHSLSPVNMDYPAPWCATFVSWLMVKAFGLDRAKHILCGNIDDYCPVLATQFRTSGRWSDTPQVGDLVFFGSVGSESHVGYVYQISAGKIRTIEGNTSSGDGLDASGGGVWAKSYVIGYSQIAGYGHPLY